jgi:NO-binding membrane sensor protein with MHYT domain
MMSMSLGGVAIWGMHFVGMASMSLNNVDGVDVPIKFQIMPTIVSLVFVLLFAYVGLYVSSKDIVFSKNKTEIVDLFVKNASELSSRDIKAIPMWHMICIISTQSFQHLFVGGLMAGSGVCCMHYLGMWAISFEGHIVWDEGVIASSIIIALVASTAAFWILFRLLSLYPQMEILRIVSSLVMALAVCGMHYTGMYVSKAFFRNS